MNKLLFTFLLLLSFSLVLAMPPFQQTSLSEKSLQLEVPIIQYHPVNNSYDFHVHVHNSSNGKLLRNDTVNCTLHVYIPSTGEHIYEGQMGFCVENNIDFEAELSAGNFTETGQYAVLFYCEVDPSVEERGGFFEHAFEVTVDGKEKTFTKLIAHTILILFLFLIIISIKYNRNNKNFEEWHNKIIDDHKNVGETMVKGMTYSLFKNTFIWYYFLVWLIILILDNIVRGYLPTYFIEYFTIIANIYSLGLFLVITFFIGYTISYMKNMANILSDKNWGVGE